MKKVMLALFGNCEYDFLLHKDISISKLIGNATGGCK